MSNQVQKNHQGIDVQVINRVQKDEAIIIPSKDPDENLPGTMNQVSSPLSSARSLIYARQQQLYNPPLITHGNNNLQKTDSKESEHKQNIFVQNINFNLKVKQKKTNVLIGAQSTSFSLPIVWQGPNTSLVGFQNNRMKLESQKQKRKQSQIITQRTTGKSAVHSNIMTTLNSRQQQRSLIEQFNMPLRGRPVTIGDRTREIFIRCDAMRQTYQNQYDGIEIGRYFTAQNQKRSDISGYQQYVSQSNKRPVQAKIYNFKPNTTIRKHRDQTFIGAQEYAYSKSNNQSSINEQDQSVKVEQKPNERSIENILRFLDIGKAEFDKMNYQNIKMKNANIVDINTNIEIPINAIDKKKNKNDFYRFLLMQNNQNNQDFKINNDILIPRSILKKGEKKNRRNSRDEQYQSSDEALLYGTHLKRNNPLLSPKFNQLLQFQQEQQKSSIVESQQQQQVGTSITPDQVKSKTDDQFTGETITPQTADGRKFQGIPHVQATDGIINIQDNTADDYEKEEAKQNRKNKDLNLDLHKVEQAPPTDQTQSSKENQTNYQHLQEIEQQLLSQSLVTQQPKKKIIRETHGGGFFETQVDVIEKEVIVDDTGNINGLYSGSRENESNANRKNQGQLKELPKDKIFGFNNFNDFRQKYFVKDVIALEEKNRLKNIKEARVKYSKRFPSYQ